MKALRDSLLGAGPLELESVLARHVSELPELAPLRELSVGDASLLSIAQHTLEALGEDPPPESAVSTGPRCAWWSAMPACRLAALLWHVGLGGVRGSGAQKGDRMPPHSRQSALAARSLLRRLGVRFTVREHTAALVLSYRKPENLVSSGAPPHSYMRLACRLDLRALYYLKKGELEALPTHLTEGLGERLEAFRERAEELSAFGTPPAPPIARKDLPEALRCNERATHRALNAARYFRLRAGLVEQDWFPVRLRQEAGSAQGRLNLLIGPAASGKSTWARDHLPPQDIISSDRMRAELTGDPTDQSRNYLVFQLCMDRLRKALNEGKTVTFDATNCSESLRERPVQAARWCGAEIHSYYLDVAPEVALERNRRRDRRVPEEVIRRHFRLLTPPALYEADQHWLVEEHGSPSLYWPAAPREARAD